LLRLGVAAGATAAGARFDGFDAEVHEHHRVNAVAAEDAAQGWDVGVIATDGDADMAAIDGTSVGRIEAAPSGARQPRFEPGVTGLRRNIGRAKRAGWVPGTRRWIGGATDASDTRARR
jgi:hypothetical protein